MTQKNMRKLAHLSLEIIGPRAKVMLIRDEIEATLRAEIQRLREELAFAREEVGFVTRDRDRLRGILDDAEKPAALGEIGGGK